MDTQLLEYFIHVATRQNISLAAAELHVSQPHLSNSVKRLEQELGAPLFDRIGKRLYLSDYGQQFLPVAREIITLLNANAVSDDGAGSFNVMLHRHSARLLELVESFKKQNPRISVSVYLDPSASFKYPPSLFDFIAGGASDAPGEGREGIRLEPIRYYAVFPARHPLAGQESVTLSQMRKEQFVFIRGVDYHYEQTYQLCVDEGLKPRSTLTANCDLLKLHFLKEGMGVGIITEVFHDIYAPMEELKLVPLRGLTTVQDTVLWVSESAGVNPAAARFLKFVKQNL